MEKKIRFGLIGIGNQGSAYAGFLSGKAKGFPGRSVRPTAPWGRCATSTPPRSSCAVSSTRSTPSSGTGRTWSPRAPATR